MQLCLVPEAMKIGRRDGEYEKMEPEMERGESEGGNGGREGRQLATEVN